MSPVYYYYLDNECRSSKHSNVHPNQVSERLCCYDVIGCDAYCAVRGVNSGCDVRGAGRCDGLCITGWRWNETSFQCQGKPIVHRWFEVERDSM